MIKFKLIKWAAAVALLFACSQVCAQVRSVTLGIRTHCPYGIRGCWPEIRDGLENAKAIDRISKEPDATTSTCEVEMRPDWRPDPDLFARNFSEMHIGVDVLGVEATVDGICERQGTNIVLRVEGIEQPVELLPIKQKVQWDWKRKEHHALSKPEREAFAKLARDAGKEGRAVRITGPLARGGTESRLTLQVRMFEVVAGKGK